MSSNIRRIREGITIEGGTPPPNTEIVELLQKLLQEALTGEIQELAYAVMYSDYNMLSDFVGDCENAPAMIGEIDVLKTNYRTMRHPSIMIRPEE